MYQADLMCFGPFSSKRESKLGNAQKFKQIFYWIPHKSPCLHLSIKFQISLTVFELYGVKGTTHSKKNHFIFFIWFWKFLIEFQILCNIMSKTFVVSIMNCKSLCLSVSKLILCPHLPQVFRVRPLPSNYAALREVFVQILNFILFYRDKNDLYLLFLSASENPSSCNGTLPIVFSLLNIYLD